MGHFERARSSLEKEKVKRDESKEGEKVTGKVTSSENVPKSAMMGEAAISCGDTISGLSVQERERERGRNRSYKVRKVVRAQRGEGDERVRGSERAAEMQSKGGKMCSQWSVLE